MKKGVKIPVYEWLRSILESEPCSRKEIKGYRFCNGIWMHSRAYDVLEYENGVQIYAVKTSRGMVYIPQDASWKHYVCF